MYYMVKIFAEPTFYGDVLQWHSYFTILLLFVTKGCFKSYLKNERNTKCKFVIVKKNLSLLSHPDLLLSETVSRSHRS